MTNPNNAIGTNGAYGGRTSVEAFNDDLALYNGRGRLSGFVVSPDSGMTVSLGGDGSTRDVAIAEDNTGNKTTINNISGSPISVTIDAAPASNSRIDAIVAYVDNPPQGTSSAVDNPAACGLIVVKGTVASSPIPPTEAMIRTAITADGASGTTAFYAIVGYVRVPNGTTDITGNLISQGPLTTISASSIPNSAITTAKIADGAVSFSKIDWTTVKTTLYENASGASSAFTLSDSPTNYEIIEVFAVDNTGTNYTSARFRGVDTRWILFMVSCGAGADATFYFKSQTLSISGTSVAFTAGRECYAQNGNISTPTASDIKWKPTKVIGYK